MNKLYDYIVNNFIDTHCKFGLADFDTILYKGEYVVYMYIDQIDDYNEFWAFSKEEIDRDIKYGRYKYVIKKSKNHYYSSLNILLSNYGLSQEELPIVYKMILETISMRLEEVENNDNLNESYSLDDKKEFFYKYVAKILYHTHTEIYEDELYEDEEGIYFVYKGISHQLISDCADFQDVVTLPFNPLKYPIDRKISEVMSSLGVTNIEEQREVYQFYLDILKDNYCIGIS